MPFTLPVLIDNRYFLTSVCQESELTITYDATQKDVRRSVFVETLRPEWAGVPEKIQAFQERVQAQVRLPFSWIAASLEFFQYQGASFLVKERKEGASLKFLASSGARLEASVLSVMLSNLCRLCVFLDIEKIAASPFALEDAFYAQGIFRINNPAIGGERAPGASSRYLSGAAELLLPLLDLQSPGAEQLRQTLLAMYHIQCSESVMPLLFLESLAPYSLGIFR